MFEELPRAEQVGRGLPDRPAARLAAFFVRYGEVMSAGDLAAIAGCYAVQEDGAPGDAAAGAVSVRRGLGLSPSLESVTQG